LRARIRREGRISFREWMQAALYDRREGYYCRSDLNRQGRAGDYRTAPETSPLFAATFARYFAKLFTELGSPPSWTILEVGAGSGEFARGALSALKSNYPDTFSATRYLIDEVSPDCRTRAALSLSEFSDRVEVLRICEITKPLANLIIFSNELIDAFAVHRVTIRNGLLRELCVGADEAGFVWVECEPDGELREYCERASMKLAEGQTAEINLEAEAFVSRAASLIKNGYVITVDYGQERRELLDPAERNDGTLRGFYRHQLISDVLSQPGEVDLTTTIDWTQIKEAGKRTQLETVRFQQLDQFLLAEGLLEELEESAARLSDSETLRLRTKSREMIMPHGLAGYFQVLVQKKHD